MERSKEAIVTIAELTQQGRTDSEAAVQEIVGQLGQISVDQNQSVPNLTQAQNPQTNEATKLRIVQTQRPSKEMLRTKKQDMLRLALKAAA